VFPVFVVFNTKQNIKRRLLKRYIYHHCASKKMINKHRPTWRLLTLKAREHRTRSVSAVSDILLQQQGGKDVIRNIALSLSHRRRSVAGGTI
jgi:hypothetical protein